MYSESSLLTATTTAMTPTADEEGSISPLQSTWSNSITIDFDFQLDNYNYNSVKGLQKRIFLPAPPNITMIHSSSSLSISSPSMPASTNTPQPYQIRSFQVISPRTKSKLPNVKSSSQR
jgi:hypothetical protein